MIRRAMESDAMRIAEMIVFGWREAYFDLIDKKYLFKQLSVGGRFEYLKPVLNSDHGYYVYEEDEIVKGFFLLGDSRELADQCEEETLVPLELVALYVEPRFKYQGIGKRLLEACAHLAKETGKSQIKLWVLEDNSSARAFYEKCHFNLSAERKWIESLGVMEVRYSKSI